MRHAFNPPAGEAEKPRVMWFYRGRTASLSSIEARLDELEAELRGG